MPMFREDGMSPRKGRKASVSYPQCPDSVPIPIQTPPGASRWLSRRLSEESIRTELCEGPLPDSPPQPVTPEETTSHAVSDRAELIQRLKRGESPTWIPNRHLESFLHQTKASSPPRTPQAINQASPGLLPAPTITPEKQDAAPAQQTVDSPLREGLNIERPRSALHSGNFTPVELSPSERAAEDAVLHDTESPFHPAHPAWMSASPPRNYTPFSFTGGAASYRREAFGSGPSPLSSSLSSSFVYKPPTSPLVQSESNEELDLTLPLDNFNINAISPGNPRRHTLNFGHSPFINAANHRQSPLRRESTFPYQAHQPRRSLNSTPNLSLMGTSPQTPALSRSRRPSFGSEASPLQHASLVGSYEESILKGRMSTTPSKPLEFTAQIGVLGLGLCKPNLRCPPHVSLPFSAVFYNYPSTAAGSKMEDGPSPYVGQIDLENGLPNPEEGQRAKRKILTRYQDVKDMGEEGISQDNPVGVLEGESGSKTTKTKRPSKFSVRAPPGGSYRIPEKGQLQIVIKNQNKTAVKLFLVPYDLAGMEPGTKTFIRQRSYTTGPIIETEVSKNAAPTHTDRPTLRYLVHLHICCPSRGRYYLYKSIRVVFANRVPDGKERLRNEVTYPDPRFTSYKPIRVMHPQTTPGINSSSNTMTPSVALATERAVRRRSAGFALGQQYHSFPHHHRNPPPMNRTPFSATNQGPAEQEMRGLEMTGSSTSTTTTTTTPLATSTRVPIAIPTSHATDTTRDNTSLVNNTLTTYGKLNKGDAGYGGYNNTPVSTNTSDIINNNKDGGTQTVAAVVTAEGLLSKRLRSLGVQQQQEQQAQQAQRP